MYTKAELATGSPVNDVGRYLMLVSVRLKKLRRELHLVESAITALTEISQGRRSRARQWRGSRATRI
jgi:hypothetical protein